MLFKDLNEILFIDIETIAQFENYNLLPERIKNVWNKKAFQINKESYPEDLYDDKSGIFAEFGKAIVIAIGLLHQNKDGQLCLRIKSFESHDEKELLMNFATFLIENNWIKKLCAHNGKEFDFPYLCRRMLINKISIPSILKISNLKPWEIPHLDTLEMWKFGDWKNYTSLETLAAVFDIPSSKDVLDGSLVSKYYYQTKDLVKIADYCKSDVFVLVQLFLNMSQLQPIDLENVTIL